MIAARAKKLIIEVSFIVSAFLLLQGFVHAVDLELKVDRFYIKTDASTEYDYTFESGDGYYPTYFDTTPTGYSEEFYNIDDEGISSTTTNIDVNSGYLSLNKNDAANFTYGPETKISNTHNIDSYYDGTYALYLLAPDTPLDTNDPFSINFYGGFDEFTYNGVELIIVYGIEELGLGADEYGILFSSTEFPGSDQYEGPPPMDLVATFASSEWSGSNKLGLKLTIDMNGNDATINAYYSTYSGSDPTPTASAGWSALDVSHSNYNQITDWGLYNHSTEMAVHYDVEFGPGPLGGGVPEPSTVILLILGLGGMYSRLKRKK